MPFGWLCGLQELHQYGRDEHAVVHHVGCHIAITQSALVLTTAEELHHIVFLYLSFVHGFSFFCLWRLHRAFARYHFVNERAFQVAVAAYLLVQIGDDSVYLAALVVEVRGDGALLGERGKSNKHA